MLRFGGPSKDCGTRRRSTRRFRGGRNRGPSAAFWAASASSPRGETSGVVIPFLVIVDQIGERVSAPEGRYGALGIERAEQDAVYRPVLVDLAFGNGMLIAVLRRRGKGNAVVIEEITLCDVDPAAAGSRCPPAAPSRPAANRARRSSPSISATEVSYPTSTFLRRK